METCNEGKFLETSCTYVLVLFRIKGSIAGKYATIAISHAEDKNMERMKSQTS